MSERSVRKAALELFNVGEVVKSNPLLLAVAWMMVIGSWRRREPPMLNALA